MFGNAIGHAIDQLFTYLGMECHFTFRNQVRTSSADMERTLMLATLGFSCPCQSLKAPRTLGQQGLRRTSGHLPCPIRTSISQRWDRYRRTNGWRQCSS